MALTPQAEALIARRDRVAQDATLDPDGLMYFIPPELRGKQLLTLKEVCRITGRSPRLMVEEATLGEAEGRSTVENFGLPVGDGRRKNVERLYTMRGVLTWMAENHHGNPARGLAIMKELARHLTRPQLTELAREVHQLLQTTK
jgi:hypothetical protein